MMLPDWKSPTWRKRFWTVAGVMLFIALAFHPELRVLLFLLDMVGAELLVALLGFQFKTFFASALTPFFHEAWRMLVPLIAAVNHATLSLHPLRFLRDFSRYALFHWVDFGPQAWHSLHRLVQTAVRGPRDDREHAPGGVSGH